MPEYEYTANQTTAFFLLGIVIGGVFIWFLTQDLIGDKVEELGTAICEEEHNMEFDKYKYGTLFCKPVDILEEYDGIKISIKNSPT